jgi:hypothetical protein
VAEHIKPLRYGNSHTIHVVKTDKVTWCGWQYMSAETFQGSHISLAATTNEPATCTKCTRAMNVETGRVSKLLPPQYQEILYEAVQEYLTDTLGNKNSR